MEVSPGNYDLMFPDDVNDSLDSVAVETCIVADFARHRLLRRRRRRRHMFLLSLGNPRSLISNYLQYSYWP